MATRLHKLVSTGSLAVTVLALTATASHAGAASQAGQGTRAEVGATNGEATDRLIVKYKDVAATAVASSATLGSARRVGLRRGLGLAALRTTATGAQVLQISKAVTVDQAAGIAAELKAVDPNVEYAEPDRILSIEMTPTDPSYAAQWDLKASATEAGALNTPAAWDLSTGRGVVVAVVDTGYRPHVDLSSSLVAGYDFITAPAIANDGSGRDADASDPGDFVTSAESSTSGGVFYGCGAYNSSWHGTHVAGTIAAVTNNAAGVAGVAYGARVQPARVLGKCGGYTSDIAAAIVWASGAAVAGVPTNPTPAKVINMSLGGAGNCSVTTQNAISTARARGTVVVVAAGNSNTNAANFSPANCSGVITVASVGRTGARAYYSNYGTVVDVAAPGGDMSTGSANGILSTLNTGTTTPGSDTYAYYQGTSMAAPHISGVVALMLGRNGTLSPDEIEARLRSSTRGFPGACATCGTGIVDARAAVAAAAVASTAVTERENNNSLATAQTVTGAYLKVTGSIATSTDLDWIKIAVGAGKKLTAVMTPNAAANFDLVAYNAAGTALVGSGNATGLTDVVTVQNTGAATANFYLRVNRIAGAGSYVLNIAQ
jgi:serine protease